MRKLIKIADGLLVSEGDTVYWHDPDDNLCSGNRTITQIVFSNTEERVDDADALITLDGGTEVYPGELSRSI